MVGGFVGGVLIGGDIIDVVVLIGGGFLMVFKFGIIDILVGSIVCVKVLVLVVSVLFELYFFGYIYFFFVGVGCVFDVVVSFKRFLLSIVIFFLLFILMVLLSLIMFVVDILG